MIVAVESSGAKLVFTFWFVPLMAATMLVVPDVILLRVVLAKPLASVTADAVVTIAPWSAVKFTVTLGTVLPCASVTLACTAFIAVPLANALSTVTFRSPDVMVAVPLSATNTASLLAECPLTVAVTAYLPDVLLVTVAVALPSAPVVPITVVMVAPDATTKFTVAFGTRLLLASVTITATLSVFTPLANAPFGSMVKLLSVMVAVELSAIKRVSA